MYTPDPGDLVAGTAEEIVAAHATTAKRVAWLRRRVHRALFDLRLMDVVGRDWVRIGTDGFEFAPLAWRQSDQLVRAIENLAAKLEDTGVRPIDEPTLRFDDDD